MLTLWTLKNSWTYYHGITLGLCLTFSPQFTRQIIQKYYSFLYTISTINKELPGEMKLYELLSLTIQCAIFDERKLTKVSWLHSQILIRCNFCIEIVNQKKITKDEKSHNHNIKFSLHKISNRNNTLAHIHSNLQ